MDTSYLLKVVDGALLLKEVNENASYDHDEDSIDANFLLIYAKDDGSGNTKLYTKDKSGNESNLVDGEGIKTVTLSWNAATTSATTGTKKAYFVVPPNMNGMNLIRVHAEVATAGVTGTQVFDVNKNGSSMLSTAISIDSGETGSDTAATPAVINESLDNVSSYDIISVDVDSIHSGTAALGEVVTLEFQLP